MRRRVVGLVVAAVLAVVATVVIVRYVEDAGDRESAGQDLADVLVAAEFIPAGTPVEQLSGSVEVGAVPASLVVEGAVTDLAQLDGLVTVADLATNEQLSLLDFATPEDAGVRTGTVDVPDDLIEISLSVAPERSLGGALLPGDRVTVIAAFDEGEAATNTVGLLLDNVLVTGLKGDQPVVLDADAVASGDDIAPVPASNFLVTVAVDGPSAERLVYGIEYGRLYLAREPIDEIEVLSRITTAENVFSG